MAYRPLRVWNPNTSTFDLVGDDRMDTHTHDEYLTSAEGNAAYEPLGAVASEASTRSAADSAEASARATADGLLVPKTTTVNGHALSANVTVTASDVGADPTGTAAGLISDTVYGAGWNGDTTTAPSKNAVYDKIETLGAGATNLSYTAAPTNGTVVSDTGADATVPLADGTNAGLLKPADFTQLSSLTSNLAGKQAGPLTGDVTTSGAAATLKNTGTAGTYGDATHIPVITTDAQGRVTTVTTATPTVADPPTVQIIARQTLK